MCTVFAFADVRGQTPRKHGQCLGTYIILHFANVLMYGPTLSRCSADSLTRLLAQVRKQGMDILFPEETYDQVQVGIYVLTDVPVLTLDWT